MHDTQHHDPGADHTVPFCAGGGPLLDYQGLLAARLRDGEPVHFRGVAQLRNVLTDGCGPCFTASRPDALRIALENASSCLDVQD